MTVTIALDASRTSLRDVPAHLRFVHALPGMPGRADFRLDAIDDLGFVFALRSEDEAPVRLFTMSPTAYFPGYAPELSAEVRDALGLTDDKAPVLLAVVHPGGDEPTTVNLLAPIVVNAESGSALQVVLDGDEWPLRAPLGSASSDAGSAV